MVVIRLNKLHREYIIELGVLVRQGQSIYLATNLFKHLEQANLTQRQLLILKLQVLCRKLNKISYFKLLRDIVNVITAGYIFLCFNKINIELFIELIKLLNIISSRQYPPLSDAVCYVDLDTIVKTKKRVIKAYAYARILAIIIRKLSKWKKLSLYSRVF